MLTTKVKAAVAKIARSKPNEEVCGFVLQDDIVVQIKNIHEDPVNHFRINPEKLIEYGENIKYIWHSHHGEGVRALLSESDINNSRAQNIPYLLYHVDFDQWDFWDKHHPHPYPLLAKGDSTTVDYYKGWPWVWGRSDCLSMFRGYYKGILGIDVADYYRGSYRQFLVDMKSGKWDMYNENLPIEGFEKIYSGLHPHLQEHDLVLMSCIPGARIAHHVGIVVNPEKLHILHHLDQNNLSTVNRLDSFDNQVHSTWRHNAFN